ncbi:hypothetical protein ABIB45_003609 [Arthrobacter sp. UYCo732]
MSLAESLEFNQEGRVPGFVSADDHDLAVWALGQ